MNKHLYSILTSLLKLLFKDNVSTSTTQEKEMGEGGAQSLFSLKPHCSWNIPEYPSSTINNTFPLSFSFVLKSPLKSSFRCFSALWYSGFCTCYRQWNSTGKSMQGTSTCFSYLRGWSGCWSQWVMLFSSVKYKSGQRLITATTWVLMNIH